MPIEPLIWVLVYDFHWSRGREGGSRTLLNVVAEHHYQINLNIELQYPGLFDVLITQCYSTSSFTPTEAYNERSAPLC